MKLANNVPSVWPGYVAAIASLVLSLLLLLAILVFALTQVGNLVSQFRADILRGLLEAESKHRWAAPLPATLTSVARLSPLAVVPATTKPPAREAKSTPRHIKLIFANGLAEIPASHRSSVVQAIERIQATSDTAWQIRATVLPHDALMERATYQLMLSVRRTLVAQAYSEKNIYLQLEQTTEAPPGYTQGEIIITVTPLVSKLSDGGAP